MTFGHSIWRRLWQSRWRGEPRTEFGGLHPDNRIDPGIEIGFACEDIDAQPVLLQVLSVPLYGVLNDETEEPAQRARACEVGAGQDPIRLRQDGLRSEFAVTVHRAPNILAHFLFSGRRRLYWGKARS